MGVFMKKNLFLVGILILQTSVFIASDRDSIHSAGSSAAGSLGSSRGSLPRGLSAISILSVHSVRSECPEPVAFGGWVAGHDSSNAGNPPRYFGVAVDDIIRRGGGFCVASRLRRQGVFSVATQTQDISLPTTQTVEGGSPIASPRISTVQTPTGVLTYDKETQAYGRLAYDNPTQRYGIVPLNGRRSSAVVHPEAVVTQIGAQTPPPVQQVGASGWSCGCLGKNY